MKKTIKRALALILAMSTLAILLVLASCGTGGAIEGFLTSDNYSFKSGKLVVKKDDATVYYTNGAVEKYLYYDKENKSYYYSEVSASGTVVKLKIDSEKYIDYHEEMVSNVAEATKLLTGFLQISDKLVANESGDYAVKEYKIVETDGIITCSKGTVSMVISEVGSTAITIPAKVLNSKVTK